MDASRRALFKGLIALPVVVAAEKLGVTKFMAAEIQEDLAKDLTRSVFQVPGTTLTDKREVWFSVANVAEVWAKHLYPQISPYSATHPTDSTGQAGFERMYETCKRMAKALDADLATGRIDERSKVIVEIPKLRMTGGRNYELVAGLDTSVNIFGMSKHRIGYIQEKIITGAEVDEAKRSLFGLS